MAQRRTSNIQEVLNRPFDFVIVGGGAAGLCLASRLSEDPNISVLVLEAGSDRFDDPKLLLPAQYGHHFHQPEYDWAIKTTAQKFSNGREYVWNRGKVLGGSSAINFLCWTKPPADEVDGETAPSLFQSKCYEHHTDWERLGNKGWNWETFQKNLRKLEGYQPLDDPTATHHLNVSDLKSQLGRDGPIKLCHPATITEPEIKAFEAWLELGIPRAPKPAFYTYGKISSSQRTLQPKGALFCAKTIDPLTYTRSYATTAFYLPCAARENLKVLTSASVNRFLTKVTQEGLLAATGVEFVYAEQTHVVNVTMEVVLCAGALKSPQILELSGIGNKALLEEAGVNAHLNLPTVGENLQEHFTYCLTYELSPDADDLTLHLLRDPQIYKEHLEKLNGHPRAGAFTLGISGLAFVPLQVISDRGDDIINAARKKFEERATYPPGLKEQYELQLNRMERTENRAAHCEVILYPGFLSHPNPPEQGKKYFTICLGTNHPFSRGSIHVASSDPAAPLKTDPHVFEEEIDLQVFVELVKFGRKVARTSPLREVLASPLKEVNPGPDVVTDEQIGNFIKSYCGTTYHAVGTLSMLPKEKGGVVDTELKVYGTSNIRVADLSIVPLHIAAHTMTTAYAIGMQAADIIKENIKVHMYEWNLRLG
ncbi:GMC oxidoreductase [Scleroderma citrinum Foug A]|uniref:GMC oxidoreductase n=1 Tax=Scleroderma citrinum Foug A TaxID=1036808 RepID=A0A0C3A0Y5_9AGAM|nr:GMC oxidoreductase [Scleroderma citrinum Foug A]